MYITQIKRFHILTFCILGLGLFFIINSQIPYAKAQEIDSAKITFGSEYSFNNASTSDITTVALNSEKFVVVYRDGGDSLNKGTAVIGNITDNDVNFNSEYTFNNSVTSHIAADKLSENTFVAAYRDEGNVNQGVAVIGTVSDNEIIFSSEYVFNNAAAKYISLVSISPTKFIVFYSDGGNSNRGTAIVGNISDNKITWGAKHTFSTSGAAYIAAGKISDNKFIIAYQDVAISNQGTAMVAILAGDEITFGAKYVFNNTTTDHIGVAVLSDNKFIIAYRDVSTYLNYGAVVVGDVTGDVITLGNESNFNTAATNFVAARSLSTSKAVIAYQDTGMANYGNAVIAEIKNNNITFGTEDTFNTAVTGYVSLASLDTSHFIVSWQDHNGGTNYGKSSIGSIPEELQEAVPAEELPIELPIKEECCSCCLPEEICIALCCPCSPQTPAEEQIVLFSADGDLVRNPNAEGTAQFDIYIIKVVGSKKFKRLILSPHVFESYEHLSWSNIKDVNQATIDEYTTSDLVRADGDTKVYKLTAEGDTGAKQWLNMTAVQFTAQGYDADSIYTINSIDRDEYMAGVELTY